MALQTKFHIDGLCEQLRRTRIHFVHCFLPQHNAGLCEVKGPGGAANAQLQKSQQSSDEILMNVPLVRSQVLMKEDYHQNNSISDSAKMNVCVAQAALYWA